MPIGINGSGTVTGISVGGLPDGIVDADMLATKTFTSYAVIADQKSGSSDGGTFNNGAWRTRDLNTEIADPDGIVSISTNQFTLQAGSYLIEATAPACQTGGHQCRLYNATDGATVQIGSAEFARSGSHSQTHSFVSARVTISGAKAFEIQHRCAVSRDDYGFGTGNSGTVNWGEGTLFCEVKIYKEA